MIYQDKEEENFCFLLNSFRCPCSLPCNYWMWMVLSGMLSSGKCPGWESKRRVITGTILVGWRLNYRKSTIPSCLRIPSERYCSFKWVGKDVKPAADEKLQVPTMLR